MAYFNSTTRKWEDLPVGYEEWSSERGKHKEIGAKVLLTNIILEPNIPDMIKRVGEMLGHSFARALWRGHKLEKKFDLMFERDESLRAWEDIIVMSPEFVAKPEQYIYMAWEEWNSEYAQRINWENKSLWSYIKHWITRSKIYQKIRDRYLNGQD